MQHKKRTWMAILLAWATATLTTTTHAQWEIEESHTTASLRGIHNVGAGVAWASGTNGTVLRTEDGGYLWQTCSIPPGAEKLDFRGIQAFDENTAIVMSSGPGGQSRLYKTTDGCQTWKLLFTNPDKDGFWDAIQFSGERGIGKREGVLIGDPVAGEFPIFKSEDDGNAWRRWGGRRKDESGSSAESAAEAGKGEALFAASNAALSVWTESLFIFVTGGTSGARLMYSDTGAFCTDMGGACSLKFTGFALPKLPIGQSSGAFAVAATNHSSYFPLRLMVVGGDYTKPDQGVGSAMFISSKDGAHLPFTSYFDIIPAQTPPHGYRSAVAYDASTKIWITVGPNGTDISTDDGRNWHPLTPTAQDDKDADKNWNALSLPFVVGPKGRIGKLRTNALNPIASTSKPASP